MREEGVGGRPEGGRPEGGGEAGLQNTQLYTRFISHLASFSRRRQPAKEAHTLCSCSNNHEKKKEEEEEWV